jgi:hypothetical protein
MSTILRRRCRELPFAELLLIVGLIVQLIIIMMPREMAYLKDSGAKLPPITLSVVSDRVLTGAVIVILAIAGIAARLSSRLIFRLTICVVLVLADVYFALALIAPNFSLITDPSGPQGGKK